MNVSRFLTSCGAVFMVPASVVPATAQLKVDQTNLVSDISGLAQLTDPNLVNAWGISFGPTSPFWISDNGRGLATLYSVPGSGPPSVSKLSLTVTIPPTGGSPEDNVSAYGTGLQWGRRLRRRKFPIRLRGRRNFRVERGNERGGRQRFWIGRCL